MLGSLGRHRFIYGDRSAARAGDIDFLAHAFFGTMLGLLGPINPAVVVALDTLCPLGKSIAYEVSLKSYLIRER
jgi:hypothetical protein